MIDYNKLGKHIDNVYTGATDNASRKIITKLSGDNLVLTFRSIVNIGREDSIEKRKKSLEAEAIELIKKKQTEIVKNYNSESDSKLRVKEESGYKNLECTFELITFSPISPVRTYKFSCCVSFELS